MTCLPRRCQVCAQWHAKAKSPDAGYLWTQLLAAFAEEAGAPDTVPAVKGELALLMQAFVGEVRGGLSCMCGTLMIGECRGAVVTPALISVALCLPAALPCSRAARALERGLHCCHVLVT